MTDDGPVPEPGHAERLELGAYLVGSLSPAERARVDRHLSDCARCRAELAELASLPGLLARLDAAEVRDQALTPSADLLPRALEAVGREQAANRRRLLRWRVAAAVAAVAAAAAVAVPVLTPGPAPPPGQPFTVAAGVTAAGTGSMEARGWGTAMRLELSGLPPAPAYQAFATSRDGRTEVAATWGPTASGRAVVSGATAIKLDDLALVEVRTVDGRALLNLPC